MKTIIANVVMLLGILLFPGINYAANPTNDVLTSLLGEMPKKLPLQTDTLEQTPLSGGMRYKNTLRIQSRFDNFEAKIYIHYVTTRQNVYRQHLKNHN